MAGFSRTKPAPFGVSNEFLNRRDTERIAEQADELDRLREIIERQNAEIQRLTNLLALERHNKPAKHQPKQRRRSAERYSSPDTIIVDGKRLVSAAQIAAQTRLHQSNVSRKLAAAGVAPDAVQGNKYYYNPAKLPELKKKRKR